MNTRAIGDALGVDQATVLRDLSGGANTPPDTITGTDGRRYPATRTTDAA